MHVDLLNAPFCYIFMLIRLRKRFERKTFLERMEENQFLFLLLYVKKVFIVKMFFLSSVHQSAYGDECFMASHVLYSNQIRIESRVVQVDGNDQKCRMHYWAMRRPDCFFVVVVALILNCT
jgi:hypothetical protein